MKGKYIVVEGNIGAGKTSLAIKLAKEFGGITVLEEFAQNTFLSQFYKDPNQFAFPLELSFLAARYQQMTQFKEIQHSNIFIADYHFEKSLLFARTNLSGPELELYESFFKIMSALAPVPDLVIFLDKDLPSLKKNIIARKRDIEKDITDDYLIKLNENYLQEIDNFAKSDFLKIDTNRLDFINNVSDYRFILNKVTYKLSANNC